jgi:hypothetical protein
MHGGEYLLVAVFFVVFRTLLSIRNASRAVA